MSPTWVEESRRQLFPARGGRSSGSSPTTVGALTGVRRASPFAWHRAAPAPAADSTLSVRESVRSFLVVPLTSRSPSGGPTGQRSASRIACYNYAKTKLPGGSRVKKKKPRQLKLNRETLRSLTLVTGGITQGLTCAQSCDSTCPGEYCYYSAPVYCSNQPDCQTYAIC
jgi:hypothetical protein